MAKLIYRTSAPKKGYVFMKSFMTHESNGSRFDKLPEAETSKTAMDLVGRTMDDLIRSLDKMGYDPTKVRFQIHFKD